MNDDVEQMKTVGISAPNPPVQGIGQGDKRPKIAGVVDPLLFRPKWPREVFIKRLKLMDRAGIPNQPHVIPDKIPGQRGRIGREDGEQNQEQYYSVLSGR